MRRTPVGGYYCHPVSKAGALLSLRGMEKLPVRRRVWPVLAVFFGAPVCAEYLQAYLTATGNLGALLGGLALLAPLYGGAALLIREISVRTGRGWRGTLALSAAFGVAMPGLIDLSMFGAHSSELSYWEELRRPTLIQPLGLALGPTLEWVTGHVLMSIGAPLALLQALAPAQRRRPLLGRVGIAVISALFAIAAVLVHFDGRQIYGYTPGPWQVVSVCLVVLGLIVAALSRWGQPLAHRKHRDRHVVPLVILLGGIAGKVAIDMVPPTWLGATGLSAVLVVGFASIHRLTVSGAWGAQETGLVGASAVIGGTLTGFLTPASEGVTFTAKYAQNAVLLLLAVALTVLVWRTTRSDDPPDASPNTPD